MAIKNNVVAITATSLLVVIFIWVFYLPTVTYWWLEDDPLFLQGIVRYGILTHFYRPEVWQDLMPYHLMPWIIFSFGIDWHLFGLEPAGYYWHHFISFALVIGIAYQVLRQFFPLWICSTILAVFVVALPSGYALQLLMVRHYIEGLGLSLLASWCYLKALHTQQTRWAYLGSIFYLCATTAKEIYVPLVTVLPFLMIGNWRQRFKMLLPFIAVALFYVGWRTYMLGIAHLFAGYDSITVPPLNWEKFLALPSVLLTTLGWHTAGHIALIIFTLSLTGIWLWQSTRYHAIYFLVWLFAVVLPIIPVLSIISPLNSRYLFLPYFLICVWLAGLLQFLSLHYGKKVSVSLGITWIISAIVSWTPENQLLTTEILNRNASEGKLVLTASTVPKILFSPYSASWHYDALLWLKEHVLKQQNTITICYDPCVCPPHQGEIMYHYKFSKFDQKVSTTCQPVQYPSIDVHFWWKDNTLFWNLSPNIGGQYWGSLNTHANVMGQFFPIPNHGHFTTGPAEILYLNVKYTTSQGLNLYSSQHLFETQQKEIHWNLPE